MGDSDCNSVEHGLGIHSHPIFHELYNPELFNLSNPCMDFYCSCGLFHFPSLADVFHDYEV